MTRVTDSTTPGRGGQSGRGGKETDGDAPTADRGWYPPRHRNGVIFDFQEEDEP